MVNSYQNYILIKMSADTLNIHQNCQHMFIIDSLKLANLLLFDDATIERPEYVRS